MKTSTEVASAVAFCVVLVAILSVTAAAIAPSRVNIRLIEVWQDTDSARIVFEWYPGTPRPGAKPLNHFDTRLLDALTGEVHDSGQQASPGVYMDSLGMGYPPAGDTVMLRVGVLAVDVDGNEARADDGSSGWTLSAAFQFYRGIVYPTPVDSVIVYPDTSDLAVAWHVRPNFAVIDDNTPAMFCCIEERRDGTNGYVKNPDSDWPIGYHQYCQGVLERWRVEVGA